MRRETPQVRGQNLLKMQQTLGELMNKDIKFNLAVHEYVSNASKTLLSD